MIATVAMAMLAATICQPDGIHIDPRLLVKIAQHESGLRIDAVNLNTNGTHDWGATQINESNFSWLNVDAAELIDQTDIVVRGEVVPRGLCVAMLASAKVLTSLSRYNSGSPTKSLPYAAAVIGTQMPSMPAPIVADGNGVLIADHPALSQGETSYGQ